MQVKKQQLEPYMEQLIGSRLRKEYDSCLLSPCLFNLYAEHIVRNAGLDKLQDEIKIGGRNINSLRCAHDTTLLLLRVKEESERAGLKLILKKLRSWHPAPLLHGK